MENLKRTIVVGSDHAGFKLKTIVKDYLVKEKNDLYNVIDVGTDSLESVDYPDFSEKLCAEVLKNENNLGLVFCGSGIGVSIACNKIPGIRCALVHDYLGAKLSREHTNCNVASLGGFFIGELLAKNIVDTFLTTNLINEEKYTRRIDKLTAIEKKVASNLH